MNIIVAAFITIFQFCVILLTSGSSCEVSVATIKPEQVPDYYWRDYFGIVPDDAIQGGTDQAGNPTYIGQAYIKNFELLPATIYSGCKYANTTAYGNEMTTDKNIKILCTKDKEKFEWIVTKNEETHLLTNCHLVVGGSEIGHSLNIGRVNHDGRLIIGKIFSYPLENRGLAIPYNGKPILFLSYEILTYSCQKTKPSLDLDLDIRFSEK